jgi:NifB/MoaA-like Fe-S oxidoreductase
MVITQVEGESLRDIIDWRWLASDATVRLTAGDQHTAGESPSEGTHEFILTRSYGESWGLSFADPLFDGLMTCRNACVFCFMTMLPQGMRPSLYERDDDYRLSFLQGNFVTLTNLARADVQRIISHRLSPLHVSLHAVTPSVRRRLMGAHHGRGLKVLENLLANDIEIHAQIVLVPGLNDGDELDAALGWIAARPGIRSAGIVPYGFTKYARIRESFDTEQARRILARIAPWQERARQQCGVTRFQPADEWYLVAHAPLPPANHYDDYPQFANGVGMLRSFEDEWPQVLVAPLRDVGIALPPASAPSVPAVSATSAPLASPPPASAVSAASAPVFLVTGEAFAPVLRRLVAESYLHTSLEVVAVRNHFFGGNVNVAGLLTAQDIIAHLKRHPVPEQGIVALPGVMFNTSGMTLDDRRAEDIATAVKRRVIVVPCTGEEASPAQTGMTCDCTDRSGGWPA